MVSVANRDDLERYPVHRSECGTVQKLNGRRLAHDAPRYPTTSGGGYCQVSPGYVRTVDGEKVAVCHHHTDTEVPSDE